MDARNTRWKDRSSVDNKQSADRRKDTSALAPASGEVSLCVIFNFQESPSHA